MNLRRQLLLVSLLILVLPWAGCQFIRETETALREGQQRMLDGTAVAIADSLAQQEEEFALPRTPERLGASQIYAHPLSRPPVIDGYFDDWPLASDSFRELDGTDGNIVFITAINDSYLYLFVDAFDSTVVFRNASPDDPLARYSDRVTLVSADADNRVAFIEFEPEAPGTIVPTRRVEGNVEELTRVLAVWQDTVTGYRLEARIPRQLIDQNIGLIVTNTGSADNSGLRHATFTGEIPGPLIKPSPRLQATIGNYLQPGQRITVTDRTGWRLAQAGDLTGTSRRSADDDLPSGWLRIAYAALLPRGGEAALEEPNPSGREKQAYVEQALTGEPATDWFRNPETGRAVVTVAEPVRAGNAQLGVVVLQQDTDAILSLTNEALARLITFTLIAMLVAAVALLGYATWLSSRIRNLSAAAEDALEDESLRAHLPSEKARDEIGDLSRSFSRVLQQLGEYNEYLRTLASKLSHELRTPLTIVSSSLENLEHEELNDSAAEYTARARDGAERLRRILNAMSEANRVEELMLHSEPVPFKLHDVLSSAVDAYADAWPARQFVYESTAEDSKVTGSPELMMQMLDKLVDNAVDFSKEGDEIRVSLTSNDAAVVMDVSNPGEPLPERMRARLFDSMVSVRAESQGKHLGLGLHIVRLIVEGHSGTVSADNTDVGVNFRVTLPLDEAAGPDAQSAR